MPIRWLKRGLAAAAIALAAFLLYRTLQGYTLDDIIRSIRKIPAGKLGAAAGFAAASYFCLTWFDWLALRYVGKPLSWRRAALASFCSLSLGHNIGLAAMSSGAIRYRFYFRWGLTAGEIVKVVLFCAATVGLGLITLGGLALLLRPDLGEKLTGFSAFLVRALGFLWLSVSAAYLLLAAVIRRPVTVGKWSVPMPPLSLALAQIGIGVANYACVAACLHQTLSALGDVSYFAVAAVFVIANLTALIAHVPGGVGVIEGVVAFLLPAGGILGALVMFRVIYFLLPLCIGGPLFGLTELYYRATKRAA